jgi:superfamily II DNA or RNA helicase
MNLRPYQNRALDAIDSAFSEVNSALIVMATGTGKTIVMSALADREIRRGGRVLILAHRAELINQAVDKLERATGISAGIEMADLCSDTDAETPPYMVVVGSVQSMCRPARLARFHPDDFTLVMIDECHHALADTYRSVVSHFSGAKLLGVTATPDRGDLRSLGEVFEKIAFEYSIVEAIKDGYLSPVRAQTIPLKIDISGVAKQNGDYQASGLGSALAPYLHQICVEILQRARDRKTVVFTPLIATSRLMLDKFAELGAAERVREVNGESKDRKETLDWFDNAPKGSIILNSMLLTEGWDSPSADCICVLRATRSRGLYCLDTQTEVLTEDGWKSDVEIGENVLAFNHLTNETSFVPVISKIRRALNPDEFFYSINGQSCDIRVTNHHRMIYDNKKRKGWKIKEAHEVASLKDGAYIPVSGHGNFAGVPLTDDEIRFIGWVMTDGTINKSTNAISITQSDSHGDYCLEIENCIKGCGFKFGRHVYEYKDDHSLNANGKCIRWTISKGIPRGRDKHLTGWARLERWIDKDLSTALFDMTEHQFSVMLEAIHHADGSKNGMPTYTIRKGNRTFIERLQMMAIQRGYRANVSVANIVGGKDLWSIFVKKCGYVKVGANLPRHRKWVKEDYAAEECWCVETKLGTIVTRRNGKVAIVGNCQMVGRGTRLCEGKENLLLLDFLWLTQSHDLCRPAVLMSNDDEVCEMITKKQEKAAGVEDIELTPETLEEAESDTVKKRHDALAKKLEEQRRKKGNLVDPLQYAYSISDINLTNYTPLTDRDAASPTMEQINRLEQLGFGCPDSFGAAELLVKTAEERHAKGMAAPKEIRLLERRHFKNVAQWTHEQASKMIRRLVANGWRTPYGIHPETYKPE